MNYGKQRENYYYSSFARLGKFALDCADRLLEHLRVFDHEALESTKDEIHKIEHAGDQEKHAVMERLVKEFMTPIDREDILELLRRIDDVTDAIEEVPMRMYMYDYKELPADTIPFLEATRECIAKMVLCLEHFPEFKKPEKLKPYIDEVIRLEEATDEIYERDMHDMYVSTTDGFARHRGEAMYSMLEETADRCREVCKHIETIMYKNV